MMTSRSGFFAPGIQPTTLSRIGMPLQLAWTYGASIVCRPIAVICPRIQSRAMTIPVPHEFRVVTPASIWIVAEIFVASGESAWISGSSTSGSFGTDASIEASVPPSSGRVVSFVLHATSARTTIQPLMQGDYQSPSASALGSTLCGASGAKPQSQSDIDAPIQTPSFFVVALGVELAARRLAHAVL